MMDPVQEADHQSGDEVKGENVALSNAALFRQLAMLKLKVVAVYIMDGFAPLVAVIAVVVAVLALNGNKSDQAQLGQSAATQESLKANVLSLRDEISKLKAEVSQEKNKLAEERKIHSEQTSRIILDLSKLQLKLKVKPTLQEQLQQAASNPAALPVMTITPLEVPAAVAPAKTVAPTVTVNKPAVKMKPVIEAIEKLNKK